jgi:tyrosine-protein phosphatase SIW14
MVSPGIYRSGYPNPKNHSFLQRLHLRSIVFISTDEYYEGMKTFLHDNNVTLYHYRLEGNQEPFGEMDPVVVAELLVKLLDVRNHPILVHCNKGKHRVGAIVGCLRKLQNWSMTSIFDEYKRQSGSKIRIADLEFIELFDHPVEFNSNHLPPWAAELQNTMY